MTGVQTCALPISVESPEVEKAEEKLMSKEGDDDAKSNDGDEDGLSPLLPTPK